LIKFYLELLLILQRLIYSYSVDNDYLDFVKRVTFFNSQIFYEKNKTSFDVKKRHHAPSCDTMLFFLWHVFDAFDTMFFQEFFIFLLGGLRCTVVCVSIYIYIYKSHRCMFSFGIQFNFINITLLSN
jgi:hypothetical protein